MKWIRYEVGSLLVMEARLLEFWRGANDPSDYAKVESVQDCCKNIKVNNGDALIFGEHLEASGVFYVFERNGGAGFIRGGLIWR